MMNLARMNLEARDRRGERRQRAVNRLAEAGRFDEATHLARAWAEREHAPYPQYAGHWNGWVVCKVTTDLRSKGGVQAKAGDWVLAYTTGGYAAQATFYSLRLGWNCSIAYGVDMRRAYGAYEARRQAEELARQAALAELRAARRAAR